MKTTRVLALLAACALAVFCPSLRADDGQNHGGDDQGENEDCQGGHIDGSETLIASVDLVPTTNAPAGAGGFAKLISENEDGVVQSSFSLTITGLDAGVYTLSIVKKSDGSTNDIGQFQIGGCGRHHDGDEDGEGDEGDDDNDGEKCCNSTTNGIVISDEDVQLPDGTDPVDVGQILISDLNGNVLLVGDLVNATGKTSVKFRAKLRLAPGSASLQAAGKAQAVGTARRGRHLNRFTMIASGLTPNTIFTVRVNGQDAGMLKSNRKGKALLHKLPANLLTVRSVHLVDPQGQTAVRAKF